MILVTVGTQVPFERLLQYIDSWLANKDEKVEVIAQIGNSSFKSTNFETFQSLQPAEFELLVDQCDLIVSHAGMGSILTALRVKKPIIIFPRKADLGEHRNDHQLATCRSFEETYGVYVARTEDELISLLESKETLESGHLDESSEYKALLNNLRGLVI